MPWFKSLRRKKTSPLQKRNLERVFSIRAGENDWILALKANGAWEFERFDDFLPCNRAGREIARASLNNLDLIRLPAEEEKIAGSPDVTADIRDVAEALKTELDLILPRLYFTTPELTSFPMAPQEISGTKSFEIWRAWQRDHDQRWSVRRLYPKPTPLQDIVTLTPDGTEMTYVSETDLSTAVSERQRENLAYLFIDSPWDNEKRPPLAVRAALCGHPEIGLRPGEIVAGFFNAASQRLAVRLQTNGEIEFWSVDRSDAWSWRDDFGPLGTSLDGDRAECRIVKTSYGRTGFDAGRMFDPQWIARTPPGPARQALMAMLCHIRPQPQSLWPETWAEKRYYSSETAIKEIGELAVRSDPGLLGCTVSVTAALPKNGAAGRTRIRESKIRLHGGEPLSWQTSTERLAMILNLAAKDLASWEDQTDASMVMMSEGSQSSHDLMENAVALAGWWKSARPSLPEDWFELAPTGRPLKRSTVAAMDLEYT